MACWFWIYKPLLETLVWTAHPNLRLLGRFQSNKLLKYQLFTWRKKQLNKTHPNLCLFSLVQSASFRSDKTGLLRTAAAIQRLHLDESPHQTHHRHHRYQLLLQRVQPSPLVLRVVQLPRLLDLALQLDGALLEALQDQQEVLVVHLAQVAGAQVFNPSIQSLWTTMESVKSQFNNFQRNRSRSNSLSEDRQTGALQGWRLLR